MAEGTDPVFAELLPVNSLLCGEPVPPGKLHVLPFAVEFTHHALPGPPEVTPADEAGAIPEDLLKDRLLKAEEFKDGTAVGLTNRLRLRAGKAGRTLRAAAGRSM